MIGDRIGVTTNVSMTGDETGKLFVYDAWNRVVAVKTSGGTVLKNLRLRCTQPPGVRNRFRHDDGLVRNPQPLDPP